MGLLTWRVNRAISQDERSIRTHCCRIGQNARGRTSSRRLRVLYEDRYILVVHKPAGLLAQPTRDRESDTLLERAGRYLTRVRGVRHPYVGLVHRIDQYTSGVMLLVCSPAALRSFQSLFREHQIERSYIAVVEGSVEPASGTIDLPLVSDRGDGRRGTAHSPGVGVCDHPFQPDRAIWRYGNSARVPP